MPSTAGGVFVSGGTAGNLSALIAARWQWRQRTKGAMNRARPIIIASGGAHSSIGLAANAMDADLVTAPVDEGGRLTAASVHATFRALSPDDRARVCAVVATAGTTNLGVIDELDGIGSFAREHDVWFHVDGAYGAAALCARSVRHLFAGIELADSFIVDPHKWLFGPYDCCALVYRDVRIGKAAHTQKAEYLDVLIQDAATSLDEAYNPADLAHHLTRRARGLPFWFSLASDGNHPAGDARRCRHGAGVVPSRTGGGAVAVHHRGAPQRMAARGLSALERSDVARRHGIRGAHHPQGRNRIAHVSGEPAHGSRADADAVRFHAGLLTMNDASP
ncbi:MAG: pyridoxal phosphate-dependent decarboxylase family protein [Ilumatobacteraceae bacterium]